MRITMTKEIMVKKIEDLCKAEGITTVKEFRSFFEYWIIGWGEMDDDFSCEAKRIEKTLTAAQWKKGYSLVTDEDIESCLATKEEKEEADRSTKVHSSPHRLSKCVLSILSCAGVSPFNIRSLPYTDFLFNIVNKDYEEKKEKTEAAEKGNAEKMSAIKAEEEKKSDFEKAA